MYRLPETQSEFCLYLRDVILGAHPEVTEQLHFSTPFFSCRGWLIYFSPLENGGVDINFTKGFRLSDPKKKLVARNRKVVRSIIFESREDYDDEVFKQLLQEAIELNLQSKKKKKPISQNADK